MSKITRNRLARGTKLTPDHIAATIDGAATQLEGKVASSEVKVRHAPWRATFHFAGNLHARMAGMGSVGGGSGTGEGETPWIDIPMVFTPFQEDMIVSPGGASTGHYRLGGFDTPTIDDVYMSWDTRDEPAVIMGDLFSGSDGGKLDFDHMDVYDNIGFDLLSKSQIYFVADADVPTVPAGVLLAESTHVSAPFAQDGMTSPFLRLNPFIVPDISLSVDPYRTYILRVNLLGLFKADFDDATGLQGHRLTSCTLSLSGTMPLVARDTGTDIQNIPSGHDGVISSPTISPDQPETGDTIKADGVEGVSDHLSQIDKELHEGLTGGYWLGGEVQPRSHMLDDGALDVIVIPLLGGGDKLDENQMGGTAYTINNHYGRQHVKLTYPLTIHHVYLMYNWTSLFDNAAVGTHDKPTNTDFEAEVELLLGRGLHSEALTYDSLAYLDITDPDNAATWETNLVDRVWSSDYTTGQNLTHNNEVEVHQVPLVGSGGTGYYAQGKPIFVGRSWDSQAARRNLDAVGPATEGEELFLEARMHVQDGVTPLPASTLFHGGATGNFMVILGKKHVMRADRRGMRRG